MPIRFLSMVEIELLENYSYLIGPYAKIKNKITAQKCKYKHIMNVVA